MSRILINVGNIYRIYTAIVLGACLFAKATSIFGDKSLVEVPVR